MGLVDSVRQKLQNKVFDRLGSTFYLLDRTVTGGDYGGYTSSQETINQEIPVTGVPYHLIPDRTAFKVFGDLDEGDMVVVFDYTLHDQISLGSKLKFQDTIYTVRQIERWILGNELIAFACVLSKDM